MNRDRSIRAALHLAGLLTLAPATASAAFIGPTPYLQASDSPFAGLGLVGFQLEDFEDGALNVPGVAASGGVVVGPSGATDSVDEDFDGVNGTGSTATSYYSGGNTAITFTFTGPLPTHAGLVWTDIGRDSQVGFGLEDVSFSAVDAFGVFLGSTGPFRLGDGLITGETDEDRFFGVINLAGIQSITLSMATSGDWELDHLQFGTAAIPEPATALLIAIAAPALLALRHRCNRLP